MCLFDTQNLLSKKYSCVMTDTHFIYYVMITRRDVTCKDNLYPQFSFDLNEIRGIRCAHSRVEKLGVS